MLGAWVLILVLIAPGGYSTSPNSMTTAYFATREHCQVAADGTIKSINVANIKGGGVAAMCFHTGGK